MLSSSSEVIGGNTVLHFNYNMQPLVFLNHKVFLQNRIEIKKIIKEVGERFKNVVSHCF